MSREPHTTFDRVKDEYNKRLPELVLQGYENDSIKVCLEPYYFFVESKGQNGVGLVAWVEIGVNLVGLKADQCRQLADWLTKAAALLDSYEAPLVS